MSARFSAAFGQGLSIGGGTLLVVVACIEPGALRVPYPCDKGMTSEPSGFLDLGSRGNGLTISNNRNVFSPLVEVRILDDSISTLTASF